MFCAKTRETVREEIVVGEMRQTRVQETGLSQGQRSVLRGTTVLEQVFLPAELY